jgi:hypothetical protein
MLAKSRRSNGYELQPASTKSSFTTEDMRRFAVEAWGQLGGNVVDGWATLNKSYFRGELKLPSGRRLAFCSWGSAGRTITLNCPRQALSLVAAPA